MGAEADRLMTKLWELRRTETQEQIDAYMATVAELERVATERDVDKLLRLFCDETHIDAMNEVRGLLAGSTRCWRRRPTGRSSSISGCCGRARRACTPRSARGSTPMRARGSWPSSTARRRSTPTSPRRWRA